MNLRNAMASIYLAACFIIAGCGTKDETTNAKIENTAQVEEVTDGSVIKITKSKDFATVKAQTQTVSEELALNGSIVPDVSRTVAVNALSGGRIAEIHARLGDVVKKGQLLLKIHSPDLANAAAALKQAKADELLAKRYYDRNKFLYDHGAVVAQKDLEAAEDALTDAQANTENAVTQVQLLNADPQHPSAFVELRAPTSGVIVEQNIALGSAAKSLDATPNLFTIADLSKVWLLCDVYENNLAHVNVGDAAAIRLNAYPDQQLQGKVVNIFSLLDPATRTAKARIELDNPQGLLRPGMFATATIIFVFALLFYNVLVSTARTFRKYRSVMAIELWPRWAASHEIPLSTCREAYSWRKSCHEYTAAISPLATSTCSARARRIFRR